MSALASISVRSATALGTLLVEDAGRPFGTRLRELAKRVSKEIELPGDKAEVLARAAFTLALRLTEQGDSSNDIADDLVSFGLVQEAKRGTVLAFLGVVEKERALFVARNRRLEAAAGGGYHLAGWEVFAELRGVFAEVDEAGRKDSDPGYSPPMLGFVPSVTLALGLHSGSEEKTIVLRLPEDDLAELERTLQLARHELEATKTRLPGGGQ